MAKNPDATASSKAAETEDDIKLTVVDPARRLPVPSAAHIASGTPIPPIRQIEILSPDDWEIFTEEWLTYYKQTGEYSELRRYSGSGDRGLDLVAFTSDDNFNAPWDAYQCKHYAVPLTPDVLYGEIGKLIYFSFSQVVPFDQSERVPRRYTFVSPRGSGITAGRLLKNPELLKERIRENWVSKCVPKLGANIDAPLEGELLSYFEQFDFSIFADKSAAELIEDHSKTPFHTSRFGGGFPQRSAPEPPPVVPMPSESLYLRKLFDAYADSLGSSVDKLQDVEDNHDLVTHYNRQRVLFYNAEALRNFARDRTPARTYEGLQEDIFNGVIDTHESAYDSGLERLRAVIKTAASVDVSGNALVSVTRVADKQGVCHQLANDDRLTWVSVLR